MHCFSFDIETIPDVEFGRRMWDLGDLSDEDVAAAMFFKQQQKTGSDFLPLHQHRIVAISVALRTADTFRVWSLGDEDADEAELVRRFYDGIDRYTPDLISWNGGGFDLPVLHYRALKHGVQAPRYWEMGDADREFRYNNYLSRFHWRHVDLMDVLAGFQPRARASLDQAAVLLGFPGKLGMSGDKVWDCFLGGGIREIRDYCETDVINTWLVYLRFEHMRGKLDAADLARELELVRTTLATLDEPHLNEFLAAWPAD
jgi:predicted PolB exonuclease-like 3'-5' exonuclease